MIRLSDRIGPEHLPETMPPETHPVLKLALERQQSGSRRGERDDGRVLALAVEGGGTRGTLSSGMCVTLEATGLVDAVDVVYGISSGALNGMYTAAGQAAIGANNYENTANRQFVDRLRWLWGRPVVDFDYLFNYISESNPLSEDGLAEGPEFRTLAVDLEEKSLELLQDFEDTGELMLGARASSSIPVLSEPTVFRGRPMLDGGLLEPIPYETALDEGATDVLALRTRPAEARKKQEKAGRLIRGDKDLAKMVLGQHAVYNRMAEDLEALSKQEDSGVFQITPPPNVIKISRSERSVANIRAGLAVGSAVCAAAFDLKPTELLWPPVPYLAGRAD